LDKELQWIGNVSFVTLHSRSYVTHIQTMFGLFAEGD